MFLKLLQVILICNQLWEPFDGWNSLTIKYFLAFGANIFNFLNSIISELIIELIVLSMYRILASALRTL